MSSTMLALIQQATGEMGLVVPTTVASSGSDDNVQMLALLNAAGNELRRRHPWQALIRDYRFTTQYVIQNGTTVSGSTTVTNIPTTAALSGGGSTWQVLGAGISPDVYIDTVDSLTQVTLTQPATASGTVSLSFCQIRYQLPDDYDRSINRTQWDKSKRWEMLGPLNSQQQEWLRSGFIATGPRMRWWLQGNKFNIWPATTTGEYLGFKYHSNYWCRDQIDTPQASLVADTDTCLFPDRLMVLGLKLKYRQIKGLDTSFLEREYAVELDIAKSVDGGSPTLSMAPGMNQILIGWGQLPDSGYGV